MKNEILQDLLDYASFKYDDVCQNLGAATLSLFSGVIGGMSAEYVISAYENTQADAVQGLYLGVGCGLGLAIPMLFKRS